MVSLVTPPLLSLLLSLSSSRGPSLQMCSLTANQQIDKSYFTDTNKKHTALDMPTNHTTRHTLKRSESSAAYWEQLHYTRYKHTHGSRGRCTLCASLALPDRFFPFFWQRETTYVQ